jgi:hypothetical protein
MTIATRGIFFKPTGDRVRVFLDGRSVGEIRPEQNGFAYFPKGRRLFMGTVMKTLFEVKKSLIEE